MEGFLTPVGDEPAKVYWRRRLTVLAVGVLLILLVWFLVSATLADSDNDSADPAISPTAGTDVAIADESSPGRPCTAEDVTVTVTPPSAPVAVKSTVTFEVSVEHTGSTACAFASDADGTSLAVRSGEDVYYNSAWCADTPVFEATNWILQPGDSEVLQTTWAGERYSETCEPQGAGAPGTYRAAISIAGISADEAVFNLAG